MKTYLDELKTTDLIVKEALSGILREPEPIDSRRRDGFIPASYNHGGWEAIGFISTFSALETNSNRGVADAERILKQAYQEAKEAYDGIVDDSEWKEFLSEYGSDYLIDCDQMLSVRFMCHGQDDSDDYHSATLDVMVNWEAPYFRAGKGMSDYKEVRLEWKTDTELKNLLESKVTELVDLFGGTKDDSY